MTNARGIDTSMWQGSISNLVKGVDFVIVKASESNFPDPWYVRNSASVLAAHKVLGAYHFAVFGPGPTRQAQTLLKAAGNAAFLVVDDESHALAHPDTVRGIIANLHKLDTQRRKVLLYSSEGTWPGDLGQDGNWVAKWSSVPPRLPWLFWQTDNGNGKLDHDQFHGDTAALVAWSKTRRPA